MGREELLKRLRKVIVIVAILLTATVVVINLSDLFDRESARADSCLDLGGKWDYAEHECVYKYPGQG